MADSGWSRRDFLRNAGLAGGSLMLPSLVSGASRRDRPNIVLIFTDDQGYADIGCYGAQGFQTPNLDRMASRGMKFTDFYVAASVCSPSRAALLTGCYPPRAGGLPVLFPHSERGLNPDERTIAEVLKTQGYATGCFGKWHLGYQEKFLPTSQGFDYYFGLPYSNDMRPLPLIENTETVEKPAKQATLTRRYTRHATRFIREHRDQPFFVYLPHTMPHVPLHVSEEFKGSSESGLYGDVIQELDWSVGQIMQTLQELGLEDNTLVLYISDNGPWLSKGDRGGSSVPLRSGKFTTYEGGFRMPCIMHWPGVIPEGSMCQEVAGTIDLLPTFAQIAGAQAPQDRIIDGKNILPLMTGEPGARSPHDAYYYYRGNNLQAVRQGRWKLREAGKPELYNLREDIAEQKNLAEKHPDRVKAMREQMKEFDSELKANRRPPGRV